MPPRLGDPTSAPQSVVGRGRDQAESVTPAARLACSTWRRLTRRSCGECVSCLCMGSPLYGYLPLQPQGSDPTAVVEGLVGGIVLHIGLPGGSERVGVRVHVVLLLGLI